MMTSDKAWLVKIQQTPSVWLSLVGLFATLPILVLIILKTYHVRYVADDFCTAASIGNGWLAAQLHWYASWSGRFSFTAIVTFLEIFGTWIAQVLPSIVLISWLILTNWTLRLTLSRTSIQLHQLTSLFISSLLLVIFVLTNPHPGQVFYWFTGNITYTLPLVLMTLALGLAIKSEQSLDMWDGVLIKNFISKQGIFVWLTGFTLFIAAGLNETYAVLQLVLLGLILVLKIIAQVQARQLDKRVLAIVGLWICMSVLSTLIMYVAPGNEIRNASFPPNPTIADTLEFSFNATNSYLIHEWQYALYACLFIVSVSLFGLNMAKSNFKDDFKLFDAINKIFAITLVAYLLAVLVQAPSFYVQHYPTSARSLASIPFTLSVGILIISYIFAQILCEFWYTKFMPLKIVLAGTLCLSVAYLVTSQTIFMIREVKREFPEMQSYSSEWDAQSDKIIGQGKSNDGGAYVERLGRTFDLEDYSTDPKHWINQCAADFYNVERLIAE